MGNPIENFENKAGFIMDLQHTVVDVVADQIEMAMALMEPSGVDVTSVNTERSMWNEWTIGYIAGAVDGATQSYSISASDPFIPLIFLGTYRRMYDNPNIKHEDLVERGFNLLNSHTRAAELGAKDMMNWLKFSFDNKGKEATDEDKFRNTPNLLQTYLTLGADEALVMAAKRGYEFQ